MILLLLLILAIPFAASADNGCIFKQSGAKLPAEISPLQDAVTVADYFRLHGSPAAKSSFLQKTKTFEQARHFIQTELGWKLPGSTRELNQPRLDVFFVTAPESFSGTTLYDQNIRIVFNERSLMRKDFPDLLIHQVSHAAQMEFKKEGEFWFYEATAGWMEFLFDAKSRSVADAQKFRLLHPGLSITENNRRSALGVSAFLELISQTNRDVIRQIWQQYSYSNGEQVVGIIERVLQLNHLPSLSSYLQNYFLLAKPDKNPVSDASLVAVAPYAAAVIHGDSEGKTSGGLLVSFDPQTGGSFSPAIVYYSEANGSGTVSFRRDLKDRWSIQVPAAGMNHYRLVIVNSSPNLIQGRVTRSYDPTIPAILEYFHADRNDSGMQLEWRTSSENGVAFWNLYRIHGGKKELLNEFPIPATIDSKEGIRYIYMDDGTGDFYSLEAVTNDGFYAPVGNTTASR